MPDSFSHHLGMLESCVRSLLALALAFVLASVTGDDGC